MRSIIVWVLPLPAPAVTVNGHAPAVMAEIAAAKGARMIQVSTDYVFGPAPVPPRPWEPGDPTGPASVYGRTKLSGEEAARAADPRTVVVRTAWVYTGRTAGPDGGTAWAPDFVGTMGRLADGDVDGQALASSGRRRDDGELHGRLLVRSETRLDHGVG